MLPGHRHIFCGITGGEKNIDLFFQQCFPYFYGRHIGDQKSIVRIFFTEAIQDLLCDRRSAGPLGPGDHEWRGFIFNFMRTEKICRKRISFNKEVQHDLTGLGQDSRLPAAEKQRITNFLLQRFDMIADCLLGDHKLPGSDGETFRSGYGSKTINIQLIHTVSFSRILPIIVPKIKI